MARRKKTSPIEDVMDLVAMLPWWAGVGLALGQLKCFVLRRSPDTQVGSISSTAGGSRRPRRPDPAARSRAGRSPHGP